MITQIPIVTFHSIDPSGSVISMTSSRFTSLLTLLKQHGYVTITLQDLVQWLSGKKTFSSPAVVITFDDGYENLYHTAFPVLESLGFQATLFLTTGYCGKKNSWLPQDASIPCLSMLTWEQVKEMTQSVFDVQAHTKTHPLLFKLSPEHARNEILGSKIDIEDRLGRKADFFAYPFGYFHRGEDILVRQCFQGACSADLAWVDPRSDRYVLPRLDMYYFSHRITSKFFLSPLFIPYLRFRQSLRMLRQSIC